MDPAAEVYFLDPLYTAIVVGLLVVVPLWRIFARAGFGPALSLLAVLPYVGVPICLAVLAFRRWPADPLPREIDR
jgi:hypothetical protein